MEISSTVRVIEMIPEVAFGEVSSQRILDGISSVEVYFLIENVCAKTSKRMHGWLTGGGMSSET